MPNRYFNSRSLSFAKTLNIPHLDFPDHLEKYGVSIFTDADELEADISNV